jgi:hypothetical protein
VLRLERMALLALHAVQQGRRGSEASEVLACTMTRLGIRLDNEASNTAEAWLERFIQEDLPALQAVGLGLDAA